MTTTEATIIYGPERCGPISQHLETAGAPAYVDHLEPVEELEEGCSDPEAILEAIGAGSMVSPANAVTGKPYTGGNVVRLLSAELEHGFTSKGASWAGYGQWLEVGRQVRKGEHGTVGRRVVIVTDKRSGKERKVVKGFRVFHLEQTDPAGETSGEVSK